MTETEEKYTFYLGSCLHYVGNLHEDTKINTNNNREPGKLDLEERSWLVEDHTTNNPEKLRCELLTKYVNVFVVLYKKVNIG